MLHSKPHFVSIIGTKFGTEVLTICCPPKLYIAFAGAKLLVAECTPRAIAMYHVFAGRKHQIPRSKRKSAHGLCLPLET
jgi:hypothetical protein